MAESTDHLTRAIIHLDRLEHNLRVLADCAGGAALWPVVKANAYGHDMVAIARHLAGLGHDTLCVADVAEARQLRAAGIQTTLVLLAPGLPEQAEAVVELGCEPMVCSPAMIEALDDAARRRHTRVPVHVMVDTGMGRDGLPPAEVAAFLRQCAQRECLRVRALMSHFARADEADKGPSEQAIAEFNAVREAAGDHSIPMCHMANSAAIFDLPASHYEAVRPGIALYGLAPSRDITHPRLGELQPVLEWQSRVTLLKEIPAGTGLSYGHSYHTARDSLIATVPVGYGDGLNRLLSDKLEMLVRGQRVPQVGRITMDQCLLDVTELRGTVATGDEVVIIGRQGDEAITADELAARLGTINYEIVTAISRRVPRVFAWF